MREQKRVKKKRVKYNNYHQIIENYLIKTTKIQKIDLLNLFGKTLHPLKSN